jgi:hypothetical protein
MLLHRIFCVWSLYQRLSLFVGIVVAVPLDKEGQQDWLGNVVMVIKEGQREMVNVC